MVEIILATFNGEKFLEEQLNSLFNQSYKNFKITVRDDGSTDNTVEIINHYITIYGDTIKLIRDDKKRLGSTLSFAELLSVVSEDYIMFCDQDDFWLEDKIELTLNKMQKLEKLNAELPLLVFTDLVEVDENLHLISKSFFYAQKLSPSNCNNPLKLLALNVVAGCTIMINKKAINVILPIPERVNHDQWSVVNVAKYGIVDYINKPTILYRQHSSNTIGANNVNLFYFLRKFSTPIKQFRIYRSLIINLTFRVSFFKFFYYKILFTLKRL